MSTWHTFIGCWGSMNERKLKVSAMVSCLKEFLEENKQCVQFQTTQFVWGLRLHQFVPYSQHCLILFTFCIFTIFIRLFMNCYYCVNNQKIFFVNRAFTLFIERSSNTPSISRNKWQSKKDSIPFYDYFKPQVE